MRLNPYNADRHLRLDQRAAWLALNAIDNAWPAAGRDPGLALSRFGCADPAAALHAVPGTPSPSRALCDLFWMHLPWAAIERALGPLRIVDLGCGAGEYAARFQGWSGGRVARYLGVDVQERPEWAAASRALPFAAFTTGNAERIGALLPPDTNMIVSQSALEHVGDEAAAAEALHVFAHARGRPLLQVHAIPSAACLRLYLWHGWRQYTPRTASAISRRFEDCSARMLVSLGGDRCNALHWRWITWPVFLRRARDRRDLDPDGYRRELEQAITGDAVDPRGSPAFYVLVLFSHGSLASIGLG